MISPNDRITFSSGIALSSRDAMYPYLWHKLIGLWVPELGKQGSQLFDFSGYKQHATLNSINPSTDWVGSARGYAVKTTNTSGKYIDCGHIAALDDASQDVTLMAWFRTTNSSNNALIAYEDNSVYQPAVDIYSYTPAGIKIGGLGSTSEFTSTVSINDGKWHLLAFVLYGGTLYIYKDGILGYSTAVAHNHSNYGSNHKLKIGHNGNISGLDADVGSILVYNRALSPWELRLLSIGAHPLSPNTTPKHAFVSNDLLLSINESVLIADENAIDISLLAGESVTLADSNNILEAITISLSETLTTNDSNSNDEGVTLQETFGISDEISGAISISIENTIALSETSSLTIPINFNKGIKIVSYNPLLVISDTDPAVLLKIDITTPSAPTYQAFEVDGIGFGRDVFVNEDMGFVFISGSNGKIAQLDINDFNTQTIINVSTNSLLAISGMLSLFIVYAMSSDTTGELFLLDFRTANVFSTQFYANSETSNQLASSGSFISGKALDSEIYILSTQNKTLDTLFYCFPTPVIASDPLVQTPIGYEKIKVYIDEVQLPDQDIQIKSVQIRHEIDSESTASFTLARNHDNFDYTLNNQYIPVSPTVSHNVRIEINGVNEFTGVITGLNCVYQNSSEYVSVESRSTTQNIKFFRTNLYLPSYDEKRSLYHVILQNPKIENPSLGVYNNTVYHGVAVELGTKRIYGPLASIQFWYDRPGVKSGDIGYESSPQAVADKIKASTFMPEPNLSYFWWAKASKVKVGLFSITGNQVVENLGGGQTKIYNWSDYEYVGTSPASLSSSQWSIDGLYYQTQKEIPDDITELGVYFVGAAPYKQISVRNGYQSNRIHYEDKEYGIVWTMDEGYDYIQFAKDTADIEYRKMLNINGDILPATSCSVDLTLDAYYFYSLGLLTRFNILNTIKAEIYENNNGFPVSIKSITIDCSSMKVTLTADNKQSQYELDILENMKPSEDDQKYIIQGFTRCLDGKFDVNRFQSLINKKPESVNFGGY